MISVDDVTDTVIQYRQAILEARKRIAELEEKVKVLESNNNSE